MKRIRILLTVVSLLLIGCSAASAAPEPTPKPARYRIACLGDSITEGVGVNDPENLWVNVLKKAPFIINAQNVGSSGTTIALPPDTALRRYAFINRFHEIDENSALIIVFGGTNDYGNDVPLGTIEEMDPTTFYGALNTLTEGLRTEYPNAILLFLTPLQRDDEKLGAPATTPYNAAGVTMEDYRQAILSVCEKNGIATLDLWNYEGMRLSDPTYATYFDDGLHPNDAGSTYLAEPILAKVRELLNVTE